MEEMTSIIIPTYNEAHNIPVLIERIDAAMRKENMSYECIVVDDNSPDGTYQVASELARRFPLQAHLRKGERGLSSAMLYGYKQAKGSIVGWIDADLQHPPELLPKLVQTMIGGGWKMVIASRIIMGGGVKDWPWYRKFTSLCGRLIVLPLTRVKDTMSGFFLIRPEILQEKSLVTIGYKLGLEIMVKGRHQGKIKEIPYLFHHRSIGQSKMSWKTHIAYLWQVALLYFHKVSK